MPNVPNSPMLSKQGEFHGSAHLTFKGNVSFNSAYAISNHVGILINGSSMNNTDDKKDFKHNLIEAGAGYFTTFGAEKNRIFEVYAGLGRGNSLRDYKNVSFDGPISKELQDVTFDKTFFQVNYSSKRKKSFNLFDKEFPLNYGTILRVSYLNMDSFTINGVAQAKEDNIFLEPVFFTRVVLSPMIQIQYTSGSNFGLKNREYLTAGNSVFSLGLIVNIGGSNIGK